MNKNLKAFIIYLIIELVAIILFVVSFAGINYFDDKINEQNFDYKTINCTVTDGYVNYGKYSSTKIYVEYEGKEYKLQEPGEAYKYLINEEIEAYLYNGKIYADTDAIGHDSKYGKIQGVFITARFILGVVVVAIPFTGLITFISSRKIKKQNANSGLNH